MKLDRDLQLKVLERLSNVYPGPIINRNFKSEFGDVDDELLVANLIYLSEHDLIDVSVIRTTTDIRVAAPKITARGMDFLLGDGGLTAILGVVTVKLHDETIRDLIASRIQDSDLPAEEKTGLLHQLKELRGESIKHLTMKLLDAGLENAPKAIPLIQSALEILMK